MGTAVGAGPYWVLSEGIHLTLHHLQLRVRGRTPKSCHFSSTAASMVLHAWLPLLPIALLCYNRFCMFALLLVYTALRQASTTPAQDVVVEAVVVAVICVFRIFPACFIFHGRIIRIVLLHVEVRFQIQVFLALG
jgi:hypothetical protein